MRLRHPLQGLRARVCTPPIAVRIAALQFDLFRHCPVCGAHLCSVLRRIVHADRARATAVDGGDRARGRGGVGEKHWDLERRKWLAAARVWREGVSCQMVSESERGGGKGGSCGQECAHTVGRPPPRAPSLHHECAPALACGT